MRVLGLSAFYHDSAAALVEDGRVVAAAQEERFTRKKHDSGFPEQAIAFCLDQAGVDLGAVDYAAFYDKPFLKFERLLETYLSFAPRGFRSNQISALVKSGRYKQARRRGAGFMKRFPRSLHTRAVKAALEKADTSRAKKTPD